MIVLVIIMSFSNKLKEIRISKNITQKTLGELVNLSRETISKSESGEREPPLSKAILLARALNVSLLTLSDITNDEYINLSSLDEKTQNKVRYIINNK